MSYKNNTLFEQAKSCMVCPRVCGVGRLLGERGACGASNVLEVAHAGLHHGEEPPISGTRGSGTIFFRHCTLRCVYCQNWQISQPLDATRGTSVQNNEGQFFSTEQLAEKMLWLQAEGAHNINLVSPTQYIPWIAEAVNAARSKGLVIPLVYNTSGYESVEMLRQLEGLIDIYLPDIKYSDDAMAQKYSGAVEYVAHNRAAIREMFRQVGLLECDAEGIARKGLIVRHLVLPQDIAGSLDALDFLASLSKEISISLMSQYSPQHKALQYPEISRCITQEEYQKVLDHAEKLGLENCWEQELASTEMYVPDFDTTQPFGDHPSPR